MVVEISSDDLIIAERLLKQNEELYPIIETSFLKNVLRRL